MRFCNLESLKIYIKKLVVNKKCWKEKFVLERRLVCKKKEKTCVKRDLLIILDALILS
jgi:hypothetical protein